jgi:hypothetical protein
VECTLDDPAPRWSRVVGLRVGAKAFAARSPGIAFSRREQIARRSCIFLAHQNLKALSGPSKMFAHSSRSVCLAHRRNAGGFEHALSQVRLDAAPVCLNDNKFQVLHGYSICPEWREQG